MQAAVKDVKNLWREVMPQIRKYSHGQNDSVYGISWVVDAKSSRLDYCAAIKLEKGGDFPEKFEETLIPGGLYAECSLPSRDALHRLYNSFFTEWLPSRQEGIAVGNTPCYEIYPHNYLHGGSMKLYIPIVAA
jgi:predicted transcriptional regulator YdeE